MKGKTRKNDRDFLDELSRRLNRFSLRVRFWFNQLQQQGATLATKTMIVQSEAIQLDHIYPNNPGCDYAEEQEEDAFVSTPDPTGRPRSNSVKQ